MRRTNSGFAVALGIWLSLGSGLSEAGAAEPNQAAGEHSVKLPPQPEPPRDVELDPTPRDAEPLPPPPARPPGARLFYEDSGDPSADFAGERTAERRERTSVPVMPRDRPGSSRWYGTTVLAVDGLALASIAIGADREEPFPMVAGVLSYLLVTPIVHGARGKGGRAWGSVGLRLALPAGGAIVSGDNPALGALFGALGATLIDALRSYDDAKAKQPAPAQRALYLAPIVDRKGAGVTLGGAF